MRLGIATCSEKPQITQSDLLAAETAARLLGAELVAVPWDLPHQPAVDALVLRSTWGYYHDVNRFRAWLDGLRVPTLNPVPLVKENLDKKYLLDFAAKGVPIVPSFLFHDANELAAGLAERSWSELVLKPAVSASSHLTFRVPRGEAPGAGLKVLTQSHGIAQPFLPEILNHGELSAIFHKALGERPAFSHALRKTPAKGEFRIQAEFGGTVNPASLDAPTLDFCQNVLSQIRGEWLYARVDFVESRSGPLLGELELIEPYLFYDQPGADLDGFARALRSHLNPLS